MTDTKDEDASSLLRTDTKRRCYLIIGLVVILVVGATVGIVVRVAVPRDRKTTNTKNDQVNSSPTLAPTFSPTSSPELLSPTSTVHSFPVVSVGSFEVLDTVPHDPDAYTQGLQLIPNDPPLQYFESTGLYGRSSVRRVNLVTGMVQEQHDLAAQFFGEGLTYFDGKFIQITWQEETAFVYNATNLEVVDVISPYSTTNGEGWGICYIEDSHVFLVSDGTQFLHTWDASTLELVDKVEVAIRNSADDDSEATLLLHLNELEWDIHSQTVLANVWQEDYIVRIDPSTGAVKNSYNLSSLSRPAEANVLNGIAITDTPNEIWVTGKLWPSMYLIRLSNG